MLGHQLRMLPPFETFWDELPAFLAWLETGQPPRAPAPFVGIPGEELVRSRASSTFRLRSRSTLVPPSRPSWTSSGSPPPTGFASNSPIKVLPEESSRIPCAAPGEGNVILHAHNRDKNAHRSYRLDRIEGARVTNQSFTPRFAIELTPSWTCLRSPPAASYSSPTA